MTEQIPELPYFNASLAMKRRDKLLAAVFEPVLGRTIDQEVFNQVLSGCVKFLRTTSRRTTVYDSISHLLGTTLTKKSAWLEAARLSANLERIRAHRPVGANAWQSESSWCMFQIMGVRPIVQARRNDSPGSFKRGAVLTIVYLGGLAVGLESKRFWSDGMVRYAGRLAGFTPSWGPRPFEKAEQLFNLRGYGYVDPAISAENPKFKHVRFTSGCCNWNLKILKLRDRYTSRCPHNQKKSLSCHNCHVGSDLCPAATHRTTYRIADCQNCHKPSFVDPSTASGTCVSCWRHLDLKTSDNRSDHHDEHSGASGQASLQPQ